MPEVSPNCYVCVYVDISIHNYTHTHIYIHTYIHTYICMYVCMHVHIFAVLSHRVGFWDFGYADCGVCYHGLYRVLQGLIGFFRGSWLV